MNIATPIDEEFAIKGLGGDKSIFLMMLAKLEDMTLMPVMENFVPAYDAANHLELKSLGHSLKGASAYIGASRLHYICFFIQQYYVINDFEQVINYYPCLVEAAIEFRTYSRKLIAEGNSK